MTMRCKYCRKELSDGGCKIAGDANRCENAHPDVLYQDRHQQKRQFRRLVRNLRLAHANGEHGDSAGKVAEETK